MHEWVASFQWDAGNIDKSYRKHGITPNETEEVFLDPSLLVIDDIKHSQKEGRFIAVGKNLSDRILFVVFTFRGDEVRVISARPANQREKRKYAQKA